MLVPESLYAENASKAGENARRAKIEERAGSLFGQPERVRSVILPTGRERGERRVGLKEARGVVPFFAGMVSL